MGLNARTDVKGFVKRLSHSLRSERTDLDRASDEDEEEEDDALPERLLSNEDLSGCLPSKRAGIQVVGRPGNGAVDLDFTWDESDVESESGCDGSFPDTAQRQSGEAAHTPELERDADGALQVPPLSIVMMVCGTRGDVQPFIALGLKLKEYGHRVRLATHKDYRKFVTDYELDFYPLGGDPKVLSDFIVKHRGVFTIDTKDAFTNLKQVEEITSSCYAACTQPDPEGSGGPFTAQAIIANPPSFGHIHCAEKLQVPLHIIFTMPWTPTRNFPHPLARIRNVRDKRPSSIAVRNYLSYLVVNEYTYAGVSGIVNRFRRKVLQLPPIRMGNSGPTIIDAHRVPFSYCWSPSLVPKPADWGDYIDVTGYLFLGEGARSSYQPDPALAAFLAAGPSPVYLGFGSLMVDDKEAVTEKILDAFLITKQRLLLSKGWAGLGEGFTLPDNVMLLDDVPHDWLLPKCSAVVHHGGAGTTAAGLLAACPTTVVPFFGDQAFWGSAVHLRGVGPRPIPIDNFSTKRLVAALEFMQQPEVKAKAIEVSEQILQEDGLDEAMQAFHRHLPVADLLAGRPTTWELAKPTVYSFISEVGGGISDLFTDPVKGAREQGVKGAFKGLGKGLGSVVTRPLQGFRMAGYSLWETMHVDSIQAAAIPEDSDDCTKDGAERKKAGSSGRPLAGFFCGSPATDSFKHAESSQPNSPRTLDSSLQAHSVALSDSSSLEDGQHGKEPEDSAPGPPPGLLHKTYKFLRTQASRRTAAS